MDRAVGISCHFNLIAVNSEHISQCQENIKIYALFGNTVSWRTSAVYPTMWWVFLNIVYYIIFPVSYTHLTPDFPPPDKNSGGESGGNNYWVEGFYTEQIQTGGIGCTEVTMYVCTDVYKRQGLYRTVIFICIITEFAVKLLKLFR